jgi:hypothetical protein
VLFPKRWVALGTADIPFGSVAVAKREGYVMTDCVSVEVNKADIRTIAVNTDESLALR